MERERERSDRPSSRLQPSHVDWNVSYRATATYEVLPRALRPSDLPHIDQHRSCVISHTKTSIELSSSRTISWYVRDATRASTGLVGGGRVRRS